MPPWRNSLLIPFEMQNKQTKQQKSQKEENILSWPHNLSLVVVVPLCSAKCRE